MELEPGPLAFLDPDQELPRPLAFGFEALAANVAGELAAAGGRLASNVARMAADLAVAPTSGLESLIARALDMHAGAAGGEIMSLAAELATARDLDAEIAFNQSHYPPEGSTPSLPNVATNPGNVFTEIPDAAAPPSGGGGETPGGGGGDGGGGGGGGTPSGDYDGRGDPRIDEAYRILAEIGRQEGASVEPSDPRLLVEKADGIDRYGGSLSAAAEAEFRPQYRRRGQ